MNEKEIIGLIKDFYSNIKKFDEWKPKADVSKEANENDLTEVFNKAVTGYDKVIKELTVEKEAKVFEMRRERVAKSKVLWEGQK